MPRNLTALALFAGCLFATALPTQTFTVGPAGNFATIAAAVPVVPDGSTLLVLPGSYGGFAISGKGLTILCQPGVMMSGASTVSGTQPHQTVVLHGLVWSSSNSAPGFDFLLEITQCAGPVLVEGMWAPQATLCWPWFQNLCKETSSLNADTCAELTLRHCTLSGRNRLFNCNTSIESCILTGDLEDGLAQTALTIGGASTQISGATIITGGPAGIAWPLPGSGIYISSGELRLLGGSVVAGAALLPWAGGRAIQLGSPGGTIRIDPRATIQHSGNAGANFYQYLAMPMVTASSSSSPGTITAVATTQPFDLTVLVVGLPGPPALVPGFTDAFWLDPNVYVFHTIGNHQPATPVSGSIQVPPGFLGTRLRWHAVAFGPTTGLQVSNPATSLIY